MFADLKDAIHAKLLSDLQHAQDFDLQIFALDAANEVLQSQGMMVSQRRKPKATFRIFIIVYGPFRAYEAVGKYVGLNLQDPLSCDRNVEYYNPQRLRRDGQQALYTHFLGSAQMCTSTVETGAKTWDLFALLEEERTYAETDGLQALSTNLYRYLFLHILIKQSNIVKHSMIYTNPF